MLTSTAEVSRDINRCQVSGVRCQKGFGFGCQEEVVNSKNYLDLEELFLTPLVKPQLAGTLN